MPVAVHIRSMCHFFSPCAAVITHIVDNSYRIMLPVIIVIIINIIIMTVVSCDSAFG